MTDEKRPTIDKETYEEYARKMDLMLDGPTTTNFEQLTAAGVELPAPHTLAEGKVRTKLWEVIAALGERRVFLADTDHLSDKELYARLFNDVLREEVPAVDEIGFNHHVPLCSCQDDEGLQIYLKYHADDKSRDAWRKDCPDMPGHEDPPYNRDCLLPQAYGPGPEAREWLKANPSPHAFASNRFRTSQVALAFVERLYEIGATTVTVDNIMFLPTHDWLPYADTFMMTCPKGKVRKRLFDFIEEDGAPDEDAGKKFADRGQSPIRLWWD